MKLNKIKTHSIIVIFILLFSINLYANQSLLIDLSEKKPLSVAHISQGLPSELLYQEEIDKMLSNYSLNLNKVLALIVNTNCIVDGDEDKTNELIIRKNKLIEWLIIKKGASADHLLYMATTRLSMDRVFLENLSSEHLIYLAELALSLGAKFSNIEKVLYTVIFPSDEIFELMIENPKNSVSMTAFLNFVVDIPCLNRGELQKKIYLINFSFDNGANLDDFSFVSFPEPEILELLMDKGLNPDQAVSLLLNVFILDKNCYAENVTSTCTIDSELVEKRSYLINLAEQRGAKHQKIDDTGWEEVVEYYNLLASKGINVKDNLDFMNQDGKTLFMLISQQGCLKCTKFFLEMGANPLIENKKHETAAMFATNSGNWKIVDEISNYKDDKDDKKYDL